MSEPVSAAADAASCLATGIAAVVCAITGVDPRVIVYAICGAVIGVVLAPSVGRWTAILCFVPAVMICAATGTAISIEWLHGSEWWRNVIAASLAMVFHKLLPVVLERAPAVLDWIAAWISTKRT